MYYSSCVKNANVAFLPELCLVLSHEYLELEFLCKPTFRYRLVQHIRIKPSSLIDLLQDTSCQSYLDLLAKLFAVEGGVLDVGFEAALGPIAHFGDGIAKPDHGVTVETSIGPLEGLKSLEYPVIL